VGFPASHTVEGRLPCISKPSAAPGGGLGPDLRPCLAIVQHTAESVSVTAFLSLLSGSHHSGSPSAHCSKSSGSLDTSKVYIVSHNGGQQVPGSMSKSYHRQGAANKYVIGWKKSEGSPPPEEPEVTECPG
jgi:hypothetical protein